MYVFHYDPATLAYVGNSPVDFCQVRPGMVIVPAWATKVPPPSGWDSRTELPHYVPEKDAWEVRQLPPPPPPEPEPEAVQVPEPDAPPVTQELLERSLRAHLEAAQNLMEQLKKGIA
ncbi:hypothetical protein DBV14_09460 [Variovorax sp. KBW07]|uniref:hypothetical protein n=1 Tax=Variovorax sp. KBW07 TaxID=2153358 RepID=UPI000F588A5A|nr:hypothetical protein [Variovorax sp. KBW07]RQO57026.1 hypothetical protein DBV14_09460 [Variovorax sp. KBW07]